MATTHDETDIDAITDALVTASRLLVAISLRSVAAVDESLTLPQFRLLMVLSAQGAMKLSDLADQLGVNPSTATRMIDRLVLANLVRRQTNPASRREVVLDLTAGGASVVAEVTLGRRREIARIVESMPVRHRSGLVAALSAFGQAGAEVR